MEENHKQAIDLSYRSGQVDAVSAIPDHLLSLVLVFCKIQRLINNLIFPVRVYNRKYEECGGLLEYNESN